ncbi:hypothetical protein OKA05_19820 [Luteolibacter arcticus]|uniref:Plasmid stabilization system protein ParE n=1 Tax=Luteolibacter arcticus TaxID=1581411 RepID=A0ABT3GMU5_9BACT|nr:hypothetical protein [Luteolibacter arcticus]MCW1924822.1 hypothetical protein [Luteolibacter arcticus]
MQVRITEDLLEKIRSLGKRERKEIGEAMNRVMSGWGQPHVHAGIGIRRLTRTIYECRVGLDDRLAFVFIATPPELVFFFLGDHDEIQRLIRRK